jgi:hypothetical protein
MSTLSTNTVKSLTTSPPAFLRYDDTEIGRLCRAWVNFNGTGTPAIRASFNVSSITDNGTGDYTINFTNALPDANYSALVSGNVGTANRDYAFNGPYAAAPTTTAFRFQCCDAATAGFTDPAYANCAVFR